MAKDDEARKADLKAREYRDEKGELHHHTHPYMERHGLDGGARKPATKASGSRPGESRSDGHDRSGGARTTTNHDEIREWAETHGGQPAAVKRTHRGGDVGIIRIMFPEAPNSEHDALEAISWEEFFEEFEARDLALLYDEDSLFSKIIGRDTAAKRKGGDNHAHR
ncbi:hypothetical protein [Phenylobacterium soli]|uniref:hypothetical protein n=1 Tax=Phenylobacterium soli TaxID=2170551 RepID=UPI001D03D105|nr:hypothetical protein [Phenylobacterium soli]